MCIPVHSFMRSFLIMTPIFLFTVYVQASRDSRLLERAHEYLPPDIQAEVPPGFSPVSTVRTMALIPMFFLFNHYLQNL